MFDDVNFKDQTIEVLSKMYTFFDLQGFKPKACFAAVGVANVDYCLAFSLKPDEVRGILDSMFNMYLERLNHDKPAE